MSQALVIPFVAKAFRKYDVRLLVSAAAIVMGGSNILMSTFNELWQFYLFGTLQGCAAAFIGMIPAPILLGNWFYKSTGTAVGISAACAGLVGMLGSSALGTLIPMLGWRTCYLIIGSAMAAIGSMLYFTNYTAVTPTIGAMPGLKAFVAAVFGGIGSIPGAVIGALIIGISENLIKAAGWTAFSDAFTFALLIIVLLFKPTGLFGEKTTDKV